MCITIASLPGCDVINFEIKVMFRIKPFFYMTKKSRQKFKNLESKKSFSREKSIFSSFLKDFHLPEVVSDLRVRL